MGLRLPVLRLKRHLQPRDGDSEIDRPDASGRGSLLASRRAGSCWQHQRAQHLIPPPQSVHTGPRSFLTGGLSLPWHLRGDDWRPRPLALMLALIVDAVLGEPPAMLHPVV